jgi:hypothetical protein
MAIPPVVCPHCGTPLPEDALVCPSCHNPVDLPALIDPPSPAEGAAEPSAAPAGDETPSAAAPHGAEERAAEPADPSSAAPRAGRPPARGGAKKPSTPPGNPFAQELARRLARVAQWADGAAALGVDLPRLPAWAEEAARTSWNPEPWAEAVRGIERIAQRRIVEAFEEWQKRTKARLTRLEAYSVDSRLERDQIEDTLHAARTGDIAQALSAYQQVDRVVALKERHLDQAREELERVVALLRDMQAIGVEPPQDPATIEDELESELRAGKLAPLKQQIRSLRLQAVNRLKAGLPKYIADYGDYLLDERAHGVATELEATELARGAREFFRGHPEEGLRRLRALQQTHGLPPNRASHAGARR